MYYTIECKKCALSLESRRNSSTTRCTARYPGCWNIIHLEFLSYSVPQLRDENLKQVFGAAKHCYRFSRSVEKMLRSTARAVSEQVLDEYSSSSPSKTRNYPPREYKHTSSSGFIQHISNASRSRNGRRNREKERYWYIWSG